MRDERRFGKQLGNSGCPKALAHRRIGPVTMSRDSYRNDDIAKPLAYLRLSLACWATKARPYRWTNGLRSSQRSATWKASVANPRSARWLVRPWRRHKCTQSSDLRDTSPSAIRTFVLAISLSGIGRALLMGRLRPGAVVAWSLLLHELVSFKQEGIFGQHAKECRVSDDPTACPVAEPLF